MPSYGFSFDVLKDYLYGGVDFKLPGNGGPRCVAFTPFGQWIFEFIVATFLISFLFDIAYKFSEVSLPTIEYGPQAERPGRRRLLAIVSLVFGMEVAYKFATRSVIFLLNPCHVITAVQIYLLAAEPSRFVTALFRIHINFLNGAVLVLMFPVTNTLFLAFETEVYFIQHVLMLVTPYYLLTLGGPYTVEPWRDWGWTTMGYASILAYHFWFLLPIAVPLQVSLSQIICPAISDPFHGPYYRMWGIAHQALFVPLLNKVYCGLCYYFITICPYTRSRTTIN